MAQKKGGLVWSSGGGSVCPRCDRPAQACVCARTPSAKGDPRGGDGVVRVGRQTKGRKGRGVTTITGLSLDGADLKQLGRELKVLCGSGGTVRGGVIEIQGDHRDQVVAELEKRGWAPKRAGG